MLLELPNGELLELVEHNYLAFIHMAFMQELLAILVFIQELHDSYTGFHTGTASYTSFHTCRPDKTGAGVSVFIENCYTHRLMLPNFYRVMNM